MRLLGLPFPICQKAQTKLIGSSFPCRWVTSNDYTRYSALYPDQFGLTVAKAHQLVVRGITYERPFIYFGELSEFAERLIIPTPLEARQAADEFLDLCLYFRIGFVCRLIVVVDCLSVKFRFAIGVLKSQDQLKASGGSLKGIDEDPGWPGDLDLLLKRPCRADIQAALQAKRDAVEEEKKRSCKRKAEQHPKAPRTSRHGCQHDV